MSVRSGFYAAGLSAEYSGRLLRGEREAAGWTLRECARHAEINPGDLSRIETGQHVPDPDTLNRILNVLQHPYSNAIHGPVVSPRTARFDTPADTEPPAPPTLFEHGLAPEPVPQPPTDSIDAAFVAFHETNPWVYSALVRLARDMQQRGRDRIGIGMLFEVLRWQHALATVDQSSDFKLNNNYRSRYARLIMDTEPDLEGVFQLRQLTSK